MKKATIKHLLKPQAIPSATGIPVLLAASLSAAFPLAALAESLEQADPLGIDPYYNVDGTLKPESERQAFDRNFSAGPRAAKADYWSYPLDGDWNVSRDFGWRGEWKPGTYGIHLAEDVPRAAGTPVKSARWGYVRHAKCNVGGYGAVVLIESPRDYEKSTDPKKWDKPIVHLYGHLKCEGIPKDRIGKLIDRGHQIGTIGDKSENGGWEPHLHFGTRNGQFKSSRLSEHLAGYTSSEDAYKKWTDPSNLINKY